jgi:membrane protein DedA with SNARE-associated domain
MEQLFYFLTDLSGSVSYWIVFGILIACGLGFPLPEDVPLIATGYLVWDQTMRFWPALAIALGGVLLGDSLLFHFGRQLGLRILKSKRPLGFLKPEKVRRTRAYFRKYGDKIVFFARFVAGFRAVAFFMAGAMKMRFWRFLLLDAVAGMLSVPVWIGIGYLFGYYFGEEISQILIKMKHLKNWFTLVSITIVILVIIRSVLKYRQSKGLQRG